jgi:DNA invertase Pin-like site-specific DNA recombinase
MFEKEGQRSMKFVAYYRVSTAKQGRSGLGLEAQRASVQTFAKDGEIVGEFVEIESGRRNDRPELAQAIQYARRQGATLIIAKLDRLSRSVGFIFTLRDAGARFLCADLPELNTLTLGVFAALAQHERELISERTKAALKAKKARGCVLGSPQNLTREATLKAAEARRRRALEDPANRRATELALLYRNCGLSYKAIAGKLNANDHVTRRGKRFSACAIQRLLKRAKQVGTVKQAA